MDILRIRPPSGGAGTEVNVRDSSAQVVAGAFGSTIMVGAYAKGPTDRAIIHSGGLGNYLRTRKGDLIRQDQTPLAAQDFYEIAKGRGTLITMRVVDGNEADAALKVFDRNAAVNVWLNEPSDRINTEFGTITAASAGTWAGSRYYFGGSVADDSVAIVGSTFATGDATTWTKDELLGRYFVIDGDAEQREWYITGNSAAGVITVDGDFTSYTQTASAVRFRIYGESQHEDGTERALTVVIGDGVQQPDAAFKLAVYEDGSEMPNSWADLSLDTNRENHWSSLINAALTNQTQHEIAATNAFSGDPALQHLKPANFAEITEPGGVSGSQVTFNIFRWLRSGTGNPYCHTFTKGTAVVPHIYTLTFTDATNFGVTVTDMNGNEIATGLPAGVLATPYVAPDPHLSGFTATAGLVAAIAGTTMTIYCRALPSDLKSLGGRFYPYAFQGTGAGGQDVTESYRVASNTADTITILGGTSMEGIAVPPGAPFHRGNVAAGAWDTTLKTFKYQLVTTAGLGVERTLTLVGANPQTAAALAIEINLLDAANELEFSVYTDTAGDEFLQVTVNFGNYGSGAGIKVTDGTLNAIVGFIPESTQYGTAPTVGRVEWRQDLVFGKDGHHDLAAADYAPVFDTQESKLNDLSQYDLGLIKVAVPGIVEATTQQANVDYCDERGHLPYGEITSTVLTEAAAALEFRTNIVPTGKQVFSFPSYGIRRVNPYGGSADYTSTLTGAILGVEAREAVQRRGFVKAPAGEAFDLGTLFRRLPTDTGGEPIPVKDWLLNPAGLRPVKHIGPRIILNGDEMAARGGTGTVWLHKVACLLHIGQELLAFTQFDYEVMDASLRGDLVRDTYAVLGAHFRAGWFEGGDLRSAVKVTSNLSNNPQEERDAGNVICDVSFRLKNAAKRTIFNVSTSGIAVVQ
jgi:hypothetical protein